MKEKYKFWLRSVFEVEVEAESQGEAMQRIFRELEAGLYDRDLRNKTTVDRT